MKTYELRTYRLKDEAAAASYAEVWWKHVPSLGALGIETHGVFRTNTDPTAVLALVSYPEGGDVVALTKAYMGSAEFRADMEGIDMSTIVGVEPQLLTPHASSPLQ